MELLSIAGKEVLILDTSIEHSQRCKCKNCRNKKIAPKIYFLLPLNFKKYFPVFIINPFLSFIFISKLYEAINSKYLEVSYNPVDFNLNQEINNFINENFSQEFAKCINLLSNRDIFNTIGYFEENIDKLSNFEMLYLSGIINFYLQNYEKSFEFFQEGYKLLYNKDELVDINPQEEIDLFFLFDFMVISLYSGNYEYFQKIFEILILFNSIFSFYAFMLYLFSLYAVKDNYILLDCFNYVKDNIDKLKSVIDSDSGKIKSYILFLLMCLSVYRIEIFNLLRDQLNILANAIDLEIKNIEDYTNVLKVCIEQDKDNILYKIALYSIDKQNKDFIKALEFLPLNKIISNYLDYVKFLDIISSKLVMMDKQIDLNFKKLRDLVENEPNNPFLWFINGLYNLVNRDFDISNNYFRGAVTTDNKLTEARIYFAFASFITGDIDKSLKILENSINYYDNYLYDIVLINLASVYKLLGKNELVENIAEELVNMESIEILNNILK